MVRVESKGVHHLGLVSALESTRDPLDPQWIPWHQVLQVASVPEDLVPIRGSILEDLNEVVIGDIGWVGSWSSALLGKFEDDLTVLPRFGNHDE